MLDSVFSGDLLDDRSGIALAGSANGGWRSMLSLWVESGQNSARDSVRKRERGDIKSVCKSFTDLMHLYEPTTWRAKIAHKRGETSTNMIKILNPSHAIFISYGRHYWCSNCPRGLSVRKVQLD